MAASKVAPPVVRQEHFADPQLARMQSALVTATSRQGLSSTCPLFDGVLVQGVFVAAATDTHVPHGLGRAWRGYIVTSVSSASTIFLAGAQRDATRYLSIQPSAQTTADFWIF